MSATEQRAAQRGILRSIIAILALTVLEFPPPIGFETRPQNDVSPLRLMLFPAILGSLKLALILVFKRPRLGAWFALVAACLNIVQILADQLRLLQPEAATIGYSVLEYVDGAFALAFDLLRVVTIETDAPFGNRERGHLRCRRRFAAPGL